ncbi:Myotubularin- protein 14 [Dissophora ornata]|nr:Myotubularin- protein 14 [Dissophora ornata]
MSSHSAPPQHLPTFRSTISPFASLSQNNLPQGLSINSVTNNKIGDERLNNNIDNDDVLDNLTNQHGLDRSLIDDADQSFDLTESGMMSFQDIKTELDTIHYPSQTPQQNQQPLAQVNDQDQFRRHILPFPFRIPRPEKKVNVAIKEYVEASSPPSSRIRRAQESAPSSTDKDKVRGKNICRSATLSNEVEVFMHNVNQKFNNLNQKRKMFLYGAGEKSPDKEDRESSLEKQRSEDIELLHQLGVTYINDLMVENRKVKYGLKVTSSEKVDSFGRYSKFNLVATPYPGVEFFQKFKANKYSARKLCFDWSQNFADAELQLPPGHHDNLGIRWRDYKSWDLIELTQNYLRLYLTHIADDTQDQAPLAATNCTAGTPAQSSKGLLIHCISGWDRTPLFISLLRISLWADGEAHQSLTAAEILYLTMGYDWFLFNHLLADRSQRGEDIFYFCFYFLKFIYGEEFSLKSISGLSKMAENPIRQNSQQPSSRSPMLKDIGRLRGTGARGDCGSSAGLDSNDAAHLGFVCEECRLLSRKSPTEPIGRTMIASAAKDSNQASSTEGKPSSWQLVTLSTTPSRDRNGFSPRAPFVPILQSMSRASLSGSPLGAKRNSYSTGFGEDSNNRNNALDQEVLDTEQPSATSPFMLTDGRFRTGIQQFNARRSSSSGIPDLFTEESKRLAQGGGRISGVEISRVATSPNLYNDRSADGFEEGYNEVGGGEASGERQMTSRKRASTFDGGLLLSVGQECYVEERDIAAKEQGEEEEEDLTSGDDDNLDEDLGIVNGSGSDTRKNPLPLFGPNQQTKPQICQVCRHSFFLDSNPSCQTRGSVDNSSFMAPRRPINVNSGSLALSQQQHHQPMGINASHQALERVRAADHLFSQDDIERVCHHNQQVNESDREEGMFQLEIEDRPPYRSALFSCNEKSELECLGAPCLMGPGCQDGPLGSGSCIDHKCSARAVSPTADETESIEGDENESFWEETSTMDYGYSPGSMLNGFGLGLTKCDPDDDDEDLRGDDQGLRRRLGSSVRDEDDDEEEEDDDDEEDCAASVNSHPSSIKMDHHENDRLFAPSLKGVFSSADRPSRGRGGGHNVSSLENSYPTGSGVQGPFTVDPIGHLNPLHDTSKEGSTISQSREEERDGQDDNTAAARKTLTRRQKLRQLRRLFMDIRNEIGDGTRSPSRTLLPDNKKSRASANSMSTAEEEEDDSGGSYNAESFSDDPSFHYRSSMAAFSNQHGSVTTANSPSISANKHHEFDLSQPLFTRGSMSSSTRHSESFIVSPVARSHHAQPQPHQQQQRQGLTAPSANGRKSPFEWAAAAASSAAASISSSASGMVSGGFGSSSASLAGTRQSPSMNPISQQQRHNSPSGSSHHSRPFALPSPHIQFLQQQQPHHHHHQPYNSVGSIQSPVSGTTTPMEDYQEMTTPLSTSSMSGERVSSDSGGLESTRRQPLVSPMMPLGSSSSSSTSSSGSFLASRIRGGAAISTAITAGNPSHIKDKGGESSGRWEW